jgi:hypothetical protein
LKCDVERFVQRLRLLNESRHIEYVLFHRPPATNNQQLITNNQRP